jgi:hypothetical protein
MLDVGRSDVRRSSVIHSEQIYDNHYKRIIFPIEAVKAEFLLHAA